MFITLGSTPPLCTAPAIAWLLVCSAGAPTAGAAELQSIVVTLDDGRYKVVAEMLVNTPPAPTFAALVDYDRFHERSEAYAQSRYLAPALDGTPRVFTRIEGCVLYVCRGIERNARLRAEPLERIVATVEIEPGGQLKYGEEIWELSPHDVGTGITYRHEIELNFWLPPVIGPWAVRSALSWGASAAAQAIEDMARHDDFVPLADSPCCRQRTTQETTAHP